MRKDKSVLKILGGVAGATQVNDSNTIAVVVDCLRATSTIPILFRNGCKEVKLTAKENVAQDLYRDDPNNCLLIGERDCIKLPGFKYGNSPAEIFNEKLDGKTVIFTSSNGAPTLTSIKKAKTIILGGIVNAVAVANLLDISIKNYNCNITFIPAGQYNNPSFETIEDWVGAVYIISRLKHLFSTDAATQNIIPKYQAIIKNSTLNSIFEDSDNGRYLSKIGYRQDVSICSTPDIVNIIPTVSTIDNGNGFVIIRPQ